jgi:hypothetical protein
VELGTLSLETATDQGVLDLWSCTWDGAVWTQATLTRLADILFDGDDYQDQLSVVGHASSGPPAETHEKVADRLENIERILRGVTTNITGGTALGPMAFGGSAATPGLITSDATTYDTTTGLFRQAANSLGIAVEGIEAIRFDLITASNPQLLVRAGTSLSAPPVSWENDPDTGLGWVSADIFRVIAGGSEAMRWDLDGTDPKAGFIGGSAGTVPGLAVIGDLNTGIGGDGSDLLRLITGGVLAMTVNDVQQVSSPTQFRCRALRTATQSISDDSAPAAVDFTAADDYDVGALHDPGSNPEDITIPTSGDGIYLIHGEVTWALFDNPGDGDYRQINIEVGAAVQATDQCWPIDNDTTTHSVTAILDLSATDVINITAAQESGAALNISDAKCMVVKLW